MEDQSHTNALISETSPYLLQHSHNPVNWYPWGENALKKAAKEGKLLIVSIGYSSCHWCHVMAHESFEDTVVARLMNDNFISIKVDREERPDIDNIYMTAVHLLNQQGGWPLNCIALPDGRPIWGGTYLPKEQWMEVLRQVSAYYKENPEQTLQYAEELAHGIRQNSIYQVEPEPNTLEEADLHRIVRKWSKQFDPEFGGNNGSPKFPMPSNLEFLLHYGVQFNDQDILDHVDLTLTSMARGGIYDQAGGGFARYSVDPIWKVPHFEKMLYDNAQLIKLYAKAYQVFNREIYGEVVRQSVEFLKRKMISDKGAFFSALDADSEGVEGNYYVWESEELKNLLEDDFELFADYYNVNETGLWEHGKYILYRTTDPEQFANDKKLDLNSFTQKIHHWNEILLKVRSSRISPGLDDKSLTSWNSLMISGLVKAYQALGNQEYLNMALTSADLIRNELWSKDQVLYRNYKNGKHSIPGFHIDYALYMEACLDLFESTMDKEWLLLAEKLSEVSMEKFLDKESGMFLYNAGNGEILITNKVETQDNVIPSSNAVMAQNLFRLGHILANSSYVDQSVAMLRQMTGQFEQYPQGFSNWGRLLLKQQNPYYEIAVVGPNAASVIEELSIEYLPNAILVGSGSESDLPLFMDRFENGKTRIFVCRDNVCQLPVEDPEDAKAIYHIN